MELYRRGKIFWFSISYQGNRIAGIFKTDNRKLAEKLYAKVLTDIVEGRYFETTKIKTTKFEEMTDKYLKEHAHSRDPRTLKNLITFFTGYMLSEIKTRVIAQFRNVRLQKVKPATVYQELAFLRRMFNVAIKEWEWCRDNPVSRLSFSVGNRNARGRWLTMEEEKASLENATNPFWLRSLFTFPCIPE